LRADGDEECAMNLFADDVAVGQRPAAVLATRLGD
jgi:hypothetical protein